MICPNGHADVYVLADVTVWVKLKQDGSLGSVRESKAIIVSEAHEYAQGYGPAADVTCATCGWQGRRRDLR